MTACSCHSSISRSVRSFTQSRCSRTGTSWPTSVPGSFTSTGRATRALCRANSRPRNSPIPGFESDRRPCPRHLISASHRRRPGGCTNIRKCGARRRPSGLVTRDWIAGRHNLARQCPFSRLSAVLSGAAMDAPWHGLAHCPECNALHTSSKCPICGHVLDLTPHRITVDDVEHVIPAATQGAIPWSTFVILQQIRLERERPLAAIDGAGGRPAQRLAIVILFWTLFEILMEGFFRAAFADLPGELADELLQRFPSIGGRLDRLYKPTWGMTFWADLEAGGFAEDAKHLRLVQERRNAFIHGDPE